MRRRAAALVALLLGGLALAGCPSEPGPVPPPPSLQGSAGTPASASGAGTGPAPPVQPRPDDGRDQLALRPTAPIVVGGVPLTVYLANTEESRELGLMHVKELPQDRGMLFIYPRAGRRRFWMRNTYVPLSLAYVAEDGTIEQLCDMRPLEDTTYPSQSVVRFVLEVNQGWFTVHGVKVGARIEGLAGLEGYQ